MQGHQHSATCGCAQYHGAELSDDLYPAIFLQGITCLNQKHQYSGRNPIKPFPSRFDKTLTLSSDCDGQVLLIIPFTQTVRLKSICVIAKSESNFPTKLRLYTNHDNPSFSIKDNIPVEEFLLNANLDGESHCAVKQSKFYNVNTLVMHLTNEGRGGEEIEVAYVGVKGSRTGQKRGVVKTAYQLVPSGKGMSMQEMEKNIARFN